MTHLINYSSYIKPPLSPKQNHSNCSQARCEFYSDKLLLQVNYQGNSSIICKGYNIKCFKNDWECYSATSATCSSKNEVSCIGEKIVCSINGEVSCQADFPNNHSTITPIPTNTPTVTPSVTPTPVNYCSYNGIDYSQFGGDYNSLNTPTNDQPAGKYRYYWNICNSSAPYCPGDQTMACQKTLSNGIFDNIGIISLNYTFSTDANQNTVLSYRTNSTYNNRCGPSLTHRTFNITFVCSDEESVSTVTEDPLCAYTVTMKSSKYCSPNKCTFNGIDYSKFDGNYSSLNTPSSIHPAGKYRFYWNICNSSAPNCPGNYSMACAKTLSNGIFDNIGVSSIGHSFSTVNQNTVLTYRTNSTYGNKCGPSLIDRTFNITFVCSDEESVSTVTEDPLCTYNVTMKSSKYCTTPLPTVTPTVTPTPTPTVTPTPTPNYCSYNGTDYSQFRGNYSSLSAASSLDPAGRWMYHWNICGPSLSCRGNSTSACQIGTDSGASYQTAGSTDLGYSFSTDGNNDTVLTYKTNSNSSLPCGNPGSYFYRQFKITFKCGTGNEISLGKVYEDNSCYYSVSMTSNLFC